VTVRPRNSFGPCPPIKYRRQNLIGLRTHVCWLACILALSSQPTMTRRLPGRHSIFYFFLKRSTGHFGRPKRLHRTITHLHMMVHLLLEETVNIMCTNLYFRALKSKQARFSMQIELPAKVLDYFS